MKYISIFLRSIVIITLFSTIVNGISNSKNPDPVEQTVETIKVCVNDSPASWPDEWKREYIETIRRVIESNRDVMHFDLRLEILQKGFVTYWGSFKKTTERSLFEVYRTRIRWYTEHLMETEFPTDQEIQKVRDQYKDIWNHAAGSLLKQFPFLDPNAVEKAKADDLNVCYRKIDTPFLPVYLRPITDEQVEKIKQQWDKLRYIRVDLLRKLDGGSTVSSDKSIALSNTERDYELTKESLSQLLGLVWKVVPQRPKYYLDAIDNRNNALKERFQLKSQAHIDKQRLERNRSRQLLQTEYISFILAALLETPHFLGNESSIITQEKSMLEQQSKASKGGGAYELMKCTQEK